MGVACSLLLLAALLNLQVLQLLQQIIILLLQLGNRCSSFSSCILLQLTLQLQSYCSPAEQLRLFVMAQARNVGVISSTRQMGGRPSE